MFVFGVFFLEMEARLQSMYNRSLPIDSHILGSLFILTYTFYHWKCSGLNFNEYCLIIIKILTWRICINNTMNEQESKENGNGQFFLSPVLVIYDGAVCKL